MGAISADLLGNASASLALVALWWRFPATRVAVACLWVLSGLDSATNLARFSASGNTAGIATSLFWIVLGAGHGMWLAHRFHAQAERRA